MQCPRLSAPHPRVRRPPQPDAQEGRPRSPHRLRRAWRDQRGQAFYVLLPVLAAVALLLALAAGTVQSVLAARAAMSRYVQIALQHVADGGVAMDPTAAGEWPLSATTAQAAAQAFSAALAQTVAGTPWQSLPVTVAAFQVFTPADLGQAAPPGYPASTIVAPGYYAAVQFQWPLDLVPWGGHVTLTVTKFMQANVFAAPDTTWNPNPTP